MSMVTPGTRCSSCTTVDFLPLLCSQCHLPFCQHHIYFHMPCASQTATSSETFDAEVGKLDRGVGICEVGGCGRESIESIGGFTKETGMDGVIAREVRCPGCGGSFCTTHRAQTSHSCSGPLQHNVRHDAYLARRSQAADLISHNFPGHKERDSVRGKMPVQKDVERLPPKREETLPPSLQPPPDPPQEEPALPKEKVKTKADKLWDIHIRKVRSSATRLGLGGEVPQEEKRYFEWAVDVKGKGVEGWKKEGKWLGKPIRSWVPLDTPLGKVMDLVITQTKTPRPSSEAERLALIQLYTPPGGQPTVTSLTLSDPASGVTEGSLIVLLLAPSNLAS
ncbi:hypothetical protein IAR50_005456 [Cryptococcus sp. DSM 104548]